MRSVIKNKILGSERLYAYSGRARADVVMITETALYGIEIKSDADTYTRLEKQIKNYEE